MFQSVRKRALGLVTKAFLFLIVLSFALWGVGDVVRGSKRTDVATVGKQRISLLEYDQEYRVATARYREMLGKDASPEMLEKLGVKKLVIDNLVTRALITQEIESLGLRVPDEAVAAQIAKEPAFQGEDGTFSKT
ncbi:MAG: SurA N-terminal domain-containing protein, partial [Alphaproteobacteria bacterium]|nr:SurA N-terminal domain-containing protein [Alphaproteobacteria bacterium]